MAKTTTPAKKTTSAKPARSKTRAATTTPRAVRKTTKVTATKPAVTMPEPKEASAPEGERVEISKKELIERLARDTDMKKGDARRALDAVLGVFREALAEGSDIAAAPLGKIKIARTKETATGQLVVCRIKLKDAAKAADTSL